MCACMLGSFSCVRLFASLWTVAYQAPLSMGFSKPQGESHEQNPKGLMENSMDRIPCPSPGDLPNPVSLIIPPALAGKSLPLAPSGEPQNNVHTLIKNPLLLKKKKLSEPSVSHRLFAVKGLTSVLVAAD